MDVSYRPVDDRERVAFSREFDRSPEQRDHLGASLLLILDRLEDLRKPTVLGKLFLAYLRGRLSLDDFLRLTAAVDRLFWGDLQALKGAGPGRLPEASWVLSLATVGLVNANSGNYGTGTRYELSQSGRDLVELALTD